MLASNKFGYVNHHEHYVHYSYNSRRGHHHA